jgi:DNA-binding CsgD family transcriptional regulator
MKKRIWKELPFTNKIYQVSEFGEVRSFNANGTNGFRRLKGRKISPSNQRLAVDLQIKERGRKSALIHRLVFFCHYYVPMVLYKKLENCNWDEFETMPLIVHQNGNVIDNALSNLQAKLTHKEVAHWALDTFPDKFIWPTKTSIIQGKDAVLCIKLLKKGIGYAEIAKRLSIQCSEMAVYRFNLANYIDIGRSYPGLTQDEKNRIPEMLQNINQKQIAMEFGVSESAVSRFVRGKR